MTVRRRAERRDSLSSAGHIGVFLNLDVFLSNRIGFLQSVGSA